MSRVSELRADKLRILQDKYQRKADRYWRDYQIDGQAFQLRTYERNLFMAETIASALEGERYNTALCEVEYRVSIIPTDDHEACVRAVKELQRQVSEREYLR